MLRIRWITTPPSTTTKWASGAAPRNQKTNSNSSETWEERLGRPVQGCKIRQLWHQTHQMKLTNSLMKISWIKQRGSRLHSLIRKWLRSKIKMKKRILITRMTRNKKMESRRMEVKRIVPLIHLHPMIPPAMSTKSTWTNSMTAMRKMLDHMQSLRQKTNSIKLKSRSKDPNLKSNSWMMWILFCRSGRWCSS